MHAYAHSTSNHAATHDMPSNAAYLANGCAHPGTVVVKALYAVVIHRAVMGAGRLVKVTCVIVAHRDPVPIDVHVLSPAGRSAEATLRLVSCAAFGSAAAVNYLTRPAAAQRLPTAGF